MPDITMCINKDCLSKFKCWRSTAKPGDHQAYFTGDPGSNKKCEHFIKERKNK